MHQPLTGDGSITVRVNSLTGADLSGQVPTVRAVPAIRCRRPTAAVQPWSKAGLIIKANTTQGSAYAAIMITGGHGVRWQYDYTHDSAGLHRHRLRRVPALAAADPLRRHDHRLRLDRRNAWTKVGTARLAGLPTTVPAGLFAASPDNAQFTQPSAAADNAGNPTVASATLRPPQPARLVHRRRVDRPRLGDDRRPAAGSPSPATVHGRGSGDIAPSDRRRRRRRPSTP